MLTTNYNNNNNNSNNIEFWIIESHFSTMLYFNILLVNILVNGKSMVKYIKKWLFLNLPYNMHIKPNGSGNIIINHPKLLSVL